MLRRLSIASRERQARPGQSACAHRAVSKNGRIICAKIVEGDNAVSPQICQACPVRAIDCGHLRFSLRRTSPSPLTVRLNGRTEVWDDDPPETRLQEAACAAKVMPVKNSRVCQGCEQRQPAGAPTQAPAPPPRQRKAPRQGNVVPFPVHRPIPVAG